MTCCDPPWSDLGLLSSPSRKNILIFRIHKSVYISRHPASQEGRFAVVTDVGCGMRWTRQRRSANTLRGRAALMRTAKSCGPDAPTLASSLRIQFAGDGGKQARSPGRARRNPLKPLRGECRVIPVNLRLLPLCFFCCTGGCGCIGHPAFPAPSDVRGREITGKTRACVPRDREAVSAHGGLFDR